MHTLFITSPTILSLSFLTIFIIILSSIIPHLDAVEICPYFSCNKHRRDTIQFPFRVPRNQSSRCGYPGFALSCHNDQTTLKLPSSSSKDPFIIEGIDYSYQLLWASDPGNCIPGRILQGDLNLSGSPYGWGPDTEEFSFFNCSSSGRVDPGAAGGGGMAVIKCLSRGNYTVVTTTDRGVEETLARGLQCKLIKRVVAPIWWPEFGSGSGSGSGSLPEDLSEGLVQLRWDIPGCRDCVVRGGLCGFDGDSGLSVGCFMSGGNGGLSLGVKYGLILGAGIPGLVCMVGLTFYISGRVRAYNHQRSGRHVSSEVSPAIYPHPIILTLGLDGPTIESYPKTVLGESRRLPKPSDGTCPICLAEYEPKETLRSIPECNHYFHAECIDEWLRMNATCPLCRNSPNNNKPPS